MKKSVDVEDDEMAGEDLATQVADLQKTVAALLQQKASGGELSEDRLEKILMRVSQMSADAAERAANPSNKTHPAISIYSYPEGDRARPRPPFKCKMLWAGAECGYDTTTAEEIELLNLAEPGLFTFRRTDGSQDQLSVEGKLLPNGSYDQLFFRFLTKERRDTLPSMITMLQQAYGVKTKEQQELETLRAQVEALQKKASVAA